MYFISATICTNLILIFNYSLTITAYVHLRCLSRNSRRGKANGLPEVIAVHPGVIATNFGPYGSAVKKIMKKILISPEAGAQASIFAASVPMSETPQDTV